MSRRRVRHIFTQEGIELKYCGKCRRWLPLSNFYKLIRISDGLRPMCRDCHCTYSRQYHAKNRDRDNKHCRQYYIENRDLNVKRSRKWHLEHNCNITKDEIDVLYLQQKGLCALCHLPLEYNKLVVEHSHDLKATRGLTHQECNTAIGYFDDNVELLQKAIDYLIQDFKTSYDNDRIIYTNHKTIRKRYLIPLLEFQDYKCAICQCEINVFNSYLDHNHSTNFMRSTLCHKCNIGLGKFRDNVGRIGQAIQYLITSEYNILIHGSLIDKNRKVS